MGEERGWRANRKKERRSSGANAAMCVYVCVYVYVCVCGRGCMGAEMEEEQACQVAVLTRQDSAVVHHMLSALLVSCFFLVFVSCTTYVVIGKACPTLSARPAPPCSGRQGLPHPVRMP